MHFPTDKTVHTTVFDIPVMGSGWEGKGGMGNQRMDPLN